MISNIIENLKIRESYEDGNFDLYSSNVRVAILFRAGKSFLFEEVSPLNLTEQELYQLIMDLEVATQRYIYPRSGVEPFSWKGILTDEHIKDISSSDRFHLSFEQRARLAASMVLSDYSKCTNKESTDLVNKCFITFAEHRELKSLSWSCTISEKRADAIIRDICEAYCEDFLKIFGKHSLCAAYGMYTNVFYNK